MVKPMRNLLYRSMADKVTPSQRSLMMAKVRSRNTQPEIEVRKLLHSLGFRFRLHRKNLPGKPDIVLPRHKAIVLVHGCFWHQHPHCSRATMPATRTAFWTNKLRRNAERDGEQIRALEDGGWRVLVVWQCETKEAEKLTRRLRVFLGVFD